MRSAVIRAQASWETYSTQYNISHQVFMEARAPLAAELDAFKAQKPTGFFGKAQHMFTGVTKIARVEQHLGRLDKLISDEEQFFRKKAYEIYRTFGGDLLEATESDTVKTQYVALAAVQEHLDKASQKIPAAIAAIEEAENNKSRKPLSRIEAYIPFFKISDAALEISGLAKKLREEQSRDADFVKIVGEERAELLLHLADKFSGDLDDYRNMKDHDLARDKMVTILQTVSRMQQDVDVKLLDMQTQSLQAVTKQSPEVAKLAQEMKPYLPAGTMESMRLQSKVNNTADFR